MPFAGKKYTTKIDMSLSSRTLVIVVTYICIRTCDVQMMLSFVPSPKYNLSCSQNLHTNNIQHCVPPNIFFQKVWNVAFKYLNL
jgi:hypothetical protein